MGKYIDADKLIAEIDNIIEMAEERWDNEQVTGAKKLCDLLGARITSLQQEQPEVDLEKETIIDYVHNHYHYDKDFDGYGHSNLRPVFTREDLVELARHFFELGLNARKEE